MTKDMLQRLIQDKFDGNLPQFKEVLLEGKNISCVEDLENKYLIFHDNRIYFMKKERDNVMCFQKIEGENEIYCFGCDLKVETRVGEKLKLYCPSCE